MRDRILIVEDERITAEELKEVLTSLGYDVLAVVSSGADAIRVAESHKPDVVLMDIRIKDDMDGTEAAQILHERFDIPVATPATAHHSAAAARKPAAELSLKDSERELILKALKEAGGNQTKAARLLGISRDIVRHRIKKLGLKPDNNAI